jgi:poly-gamma-glutamate capsule biosynthesis protein CapA/YwtB (metallophosphatase superfamily)
MDDAAVTLFFCGDVMTGRGVDQILAHPSSPELREPYVKDAREYVRLAEQAHGGVSRPVAPSYIWGDALVEWARVAPAARVVNLETSITMSDDYSPGKVIHYRMHPDNGACLTAAAIDVCVLANNHVLDFGRSGLVETLRLLQYLSIETAGAGESLDEARRTAVRQLPGGGRLMVTACGHESSGIAEEWAASADEAGVDWLPDLSAGTASAIAASATAGKRPGDVAVVSLHWGDNWGYDVPSDHANFAHQLVDAGVDIVHGHSSHHVRPIEFYRGKLVLYGCGDFVDDYEGITGHESYRSDLSLMFFPSVDRATGRIVSLAITPMRMRRLRLNRAPAEDARWLCDTLNRINAPFGVKAELDAAGHLTLAGPRGDGKA